MHSQVRPEVAQLRIPKLTLPQHQDALQQNVSPFDYPSDLKAQVMERVGARNWAPYQNPYPHALLDRLSTYLDLPTDMLLAGNGSAELIYVVLNALAGRGDHIVLNTPNFVRYQLIGLSTGAAVHMVPSSEEEGFALPVDALLEKAQEHSARLIAICSPNNPTGVTFAADDIRRLAGESNALILIDAAYEEFSHQDTRTLPQEFENVIILRTFSKAMNMAGLRVGYAIMHPTLAGELEKAKLHYVPNIFSETAAIVALENIERFQAHVDTIVQERERVFHGLADVPHVHVFPSTGNFFLMRFPQNSTGVFDYLLHEHAILSMNVGKMPMLQQHLRISLGTPEQNDRLLRALRALPALTDSPKVETLPVLA